MLLREHAQTSLNILCMLPVAMAQAVSGGVADCNTLCTFDFVDDVTFSYYGPSGGVSLLQQRHARG